MKVILISDVPNLGKIGDTVNIQKGYGRNFLFPKKLAIPLTSGAVKHAEFIKKQKATKSEKILLTSKSLADKLEGISVDIPVEISEEDKIYGTVSSAMISDALKEKGFDIDKKFIEIEAPIKSLGVYNVSIKLHETIEPKIRVWVVKK